MKQLAKVIDVVKNDTEEVVLVVKKNSRDTLIDYGFLGTETMFRITKGKRHMYTEWHGESKSACYEFSRSCRAVISKIWRDKSDMIIDYVVKYLKINIE